MNKFLKAIWNAAKSIFKKARVEDFLEETLTWALQRCEARGMEIIRDLAARTETRSDDALVEAIAHYRATGKIDPTWRYEDALKELAKYALANTPGIPPLAGFALNWVIETLYVRFQAERGRLPLKDING